MMHFDKYHGLGNDYLVIAPQTDVLLSEDRIRRICDRNYGMGSDGILLGPMDTELADFALKIYNPDGSEAEKSGNGLRIFARYLFDRQMVSQSPFTMDTLGGIVTARVYDGGKMVSVDMGRITFESTRIPVAGQRREVLNEEVQLSGESIVFSAAAIGNPHCVVIRDRISPELARRTGPLLETHPLFPHRINVQFVKILDRENIAIEIWERGAGYTLASGSSSSAAAAVSHRLGLTGNDVTVHMPGGRLAIHISDDWEITLTGPVTRVGGGQMDDEMFW